MDPLFSTRRLMTRAWERLSDRQDRDKLFSALAAGDPDGEVELAVLGKELIREMYAARSLTAARWKLVAFYQRAAEADVPELTRLAKTVSASEDEILNYHVTGISNGPTEAQNLIAEKVRRIAHGMREPRELPAPVVASLGRQMEHSINCLNQGPSPTPRHRVEPRYRCDQPITTRPDAIPGSKTPPRRGRKRSVSRDWVQ